MVAPFEVQAAPVAAVPLPHVQMGAALHAVASLAPVAPPVLVWAGHLLQLVALAPVEYVLTGHGVQVAVVLLPSFRAVPAGHAAQILFVEAVGLADWNCPGAQVAAAWQGLLSFSE